MAEAPSLVKLQHQYGYAVKFQLMDVSSKEKLL